jgi:hypothetical protein
MSNHFLGCCNEDVLWNNAKQILKPVYKQQAGGFVGYQAFVTNMWNHWTGASGGPNTSGCAWWANRIAHWIWQMNNTVLTLYQFQLKMAKINFAQAMHVDCCCPGPVPSFTSPYIAAKIITDFNLDTKYIKANGETRGFTISGDDKSVFSLYIKSRSNYYNFTTNLFQVAKTGLINISLEKGNYRGKIVFPKLSDTSIGVKHDFYLSAEGSYNTKHKEYTEIRFIDNSIDINSSTGSNSAVLQKTIYQAPNVTVTAAGYSPNGTVTSASATTDATAVSIDKPVNNIPFSFTWTVTALKSLTINRQPIASDIMTFVTRPIGAAVTIDGDTVTSPVTCRRWSMANIDGLQPGMLVTPVVIDSGAGTGNGFTSNATIKEYLDQTTIFEGQENEYKVDNVRIPGVDTLSEKPTTTRDATTQVTTSVQTGNITFDQQASLHWAGDSTNIYAYDSSNINKLTQYDLEFSDLAVALTGITTTTTTASSASTTLNVTSAVGLAENISTVSGIGIDPEAVNPTITTIKDLAGGTYLASSTGYPAGELTLDAAQTLESGITLSFNGAGTVITITGNIKVNNAGPEDIVLYFDLEKFITMNPAP